MSNMIDELTAALLCSASLLFLCDIVSVASCASSELCVISRFRDDAASLTLVLLAESTSFISSLAFVCAMRCFPGRQVLSEPLSCMWRDM